MKPRTRLIAALVGCCLLAALYLAVRAPKREARAIPGQELSAGVGPTGETTLALADSAPGRDLGRSPVEPPPAPSAAEIFDEISASIYPLGRRAQVRFRVVDAATGEVPNGLVLRQLGRKVVDVDVVPTSTVGDCVVEVVAPPVATLEIHAPGFAPEGRTLRSTDWERDFAQKIAVIDLGFIALSKSRAIELEIPPGLDVEQGGERWQVFVYEPRSRDLSSRGVLPAETPPRQGVRCELSEQDCGKMLIAVSPGGVAQCRLRVEDWAAQKLVLKAVEFDRFELTCVVPPGAEPSECRVRIVHGGGIGAAIRHAEFTDPALAESLGVAASGVKTGIPRAFNIATSMDPKGSALHVGRICTASSKGAGLRGGLRLDSIPLEDLAAEPQAIKLVSSKTHPTPPRDQTLQVEVQVLDAETDVPVAGVVTIVADGRTATLSGNSVIMSVPRQGTLFGVVKAHGYIQKRLEIDSGRIDAGSLGFTVHLRAAAETIVRVVDQDDVPVVGIMFSFSRALIGGVGFQCRTDDAGLLHLKEVGSRERLTVAPPERLVSNGLLRDMEPTSVVGGVADQVLRVRRGVGVKPVTVHATLGGTPLDAGYLANCAVMSTSRAGAKRPMRLFKGAQVVLSGSTAIIHGLSPGNWIVALESSGGEQGVTAFTVPPGGSDGVHIDCAMCRLARIAGRVEARLDPHQMPFLRVMCVSSHIWSGAEELDPQPYMLQDSWRLASRGEVDSSGAFAFDQMPPGDYMLQIVHPPGATSELASANVAANGDSAEGVVLVAVLEAVVDLAGLGSSPIAELTLNSEAGTAALVLEILAEGDVIRSWSGAQLRELILGDGEPLSISPGPVEIRLRLAPQADATEPAILWSATRQLAAGERWEAVRD